MSAGTQAYGPRYANWGWRVLSSLIDTLVFYLPLLLVFVGVNALGMVDAEGDPDGPVANLVVGVAAALALGFAVVNRIVLDGRGQSVGRRLTGTRLVSLRNGTPIGAGRAALRNLCHVLDSIPLDIGYLMPLFTKERQTLADMVMRTVVVRVRS